MEDLPFQTPTQFVALALTLFAGLLFGLALAPGGRKWKRRFQEHDISASAYRHQAEMDLKQAQQRIAELEADRTRIDRALADARTAAANAAAAPPPVAQATPPAPPSDTGIGWRGWFGWSGDNLARIRGIDAPRATQLNQLGIKTYREIEKMTAPDESALEERLGMEKGSIAAQCWREQAALLRTGNDAEHARRFGA